MNQPCPCRCHIPRVQQLSEAVRNKDCNQAGHMLRNGCWKILAVSSIDFESTDGWDVIDELADDFVEVRCARVQATLCRAEATRTAEFQNHSAQDDVPQVQYRCKARYAKDAKDVVVLWSKSLTTQNHAEPWLVAWRSCPLLELHFSFPSCKATSVEIRSALSGCNIALKLPYLLCERDKADTYRLIRGHLSAQGWMETSTIPWFLIFISPRSIHRSFAVVAWHAKRQRRIPSEDARASGSKTHRVLDSLTSP